MLNGKVAIVTGAAQGIGFAISEAFAQAGCQTVLLDINQPAAQKAAASLLAKSIGLHADVSDPYSVNTAVAKAVETFGKVDILVNNAGICPIVPVEEITVDEWDNVLAINLRGPFLCSQAVIPIMQSQGKGKIVNISSISGQMGSIAAGLHYSASKAGLLGMTKSLARMLAPSIQVNAIAPGPVETEMTASWSDETKSGLVAMIPTGRYGLPAEIAAATLFLASDGADFITGQTISVNGGLLMV
jgi:3-oxoacyl-[acyl-carrier protein] reductase